MHWFLEYEINLLYTILGLFIICLASQKSIKQLELQQIKGSAEMALMMTGGTVIIPIRLANWNSAFQRSITMDKIWGIYNIFLPNRQWIFSKYSNSYPTFYPWSDIWDFFVMKFSLLKCNITICFTGPSSIDFKQWSRVSFTNRDELHQHCDKGINK